MTYAETYRYQAFNLPKQPRECYRDCGAVRSAQEEEPLQQVAFDAEDAAMYDGGGRVASSPFSSSMTSRKNAATSSTSGSSDGAANFWTGSRASSRDSTDSATSMSRQLEAEAGGVDELADSLWEFEWDALPPPPSMPSMSDGDKLWMMETETSGRPGEAGAAPGHLFSNDNWLGRKASSSSSSLSSSMSSAGAWSHPQSFTSATAGSPWGAHISHGDTFSDDKARRHWGTTPAGSRMHSSTSTQADRPAAGPAAMLEQASSSSRPADQLQQHHQPHSFTQDDRSFYPQTLPSSRLSSTPAHLPQSGYPAVTPQSPAPSWQQPNQTPSLPPYALHQQSLQDYQQQYHAPSPAAALNVSTSYPYYNYGHPGATADHQQRNYFVKPVETVSRPMSPVSNHSSSSSSSRPHSAASQHSFAPSGPLYSWSTGTDGTPGWAHSDPTAAWQQPQQTLNPYQQPYQTQAYPSCMETSQHQHVPNQPYSTSSEQSQARHMPSDSSHEQSSRQSTHTVNSTGMPYSGGQYNQISTTAPSLYRSTSYWQSQTVTNAIHIQTDFQPPHSFQTYPQSYGSDPNLVESNGRLEDLNSAYQPASTSFMSDVISPQLLHSNLHENAQHGSYGSVPRSHFTSQPSDSAAQNPTATSSNTNRDVAQNLSYLVNRNVPVQSTAALDSGFEELPLHFDYSKPGSPKPIACLSTSQPKNLGNHKSSLSVEPAEVGQSNNDWRIASPINNYNVNNSHAHTSSVLLSPSTASDSGTSSLFGKGQKRRRHGRSIVNGRNDSGSGTSLTSAESQPSTSPGQIKSKGQYDSRIASDTNVGSLPPHSTGNSDSTMPNHMEPLPQISMLHLNGPIAGHNQPQSYSYANPRPLRAPSSSFYDNNEPPPAQEIDEGGNDLHSENENLEKSGNSGGRRLYECKLCPRKFPRPSALVVHERIHSGDKPFVCEYCARPFTVASNLRRHQKIHAKEQTKTPAEKAVAPSQSSDESTIKGPPATKQRLDSYSTFQGSDKSDSKYLDAKSDGFLASDKQPSLASGAGDAGDSDGDMYEEGSQGSSPMAGHFDLPTLRARDYAISTPAPTSTSEAQSVKKEQGGDMQQSLDLIRQWSRKVT